MVDSTNLGRFRDSPRREVDKLAEGHPVQRRVRTVSTGRDCLRDGGPSRREFVASTSEGRIVKTAFLTRRNMIMLINLGYDGPSLREQFGIVPRELLDAIHVDYLATDPIVRRYLGCTAKNSLRAIVEAIFLDPNVTVEAKLQELLEMGTREGQPIRHLYHKPAYVQKILREEGKVFKINSNPTWKGKERKNRNRKEVRENGSSY